MQYILFIEKREDVRRVVEVLLRSRGFYLLPAVDIIEAMKHAEKADMIVMCVSDDTVLEAQTMLEQLRDGNRKPAIAFTTGVVEENRRLLREAGFDRVLKEPLNVNHLIEALFEVGG